MAVQSKHLPIDIISQIIIRLPVDSIVRCMCVCKAWYSLIKNSNFISQHLDYSASIGEGYLVYTPHITERQLPIKLRAICDKTFAEVSEWEIPLNSKGFYIHGCVNGLICLTDDDSSIHIFNPSIRKCKSIGSFNFSGKLVSYYSFGFGYDPNRNDYKVVWFDHRDNGDHDVLITMPKAQVKVYSLRTDSWKTVRSDFPWIAPGESNEGAYLNGSLHWWMKRSDSDYETIMSFDVGLEKFQEILLPEDVDILHEKFVGVVKGRLAIFAFRFNIYHTPSDEEYCERCSVWVMNEDGVAGSWARQFHVVVPKGVFRTLCFTNNEEVILYVGVNQVLLYDMRTNMLTKLDVACGCLVPYVKSLVLLD